MLVAAELFVGTFALIGPPKCYTYWPFQYGDYVQYTNEVMDEFDIKESATDRITNPDISLNANYPLIMRRGALSSFTAALQSDTQLSAYNLGYSRYFLWTLDSGGTVFTEALLHVTQAINTNELDKELYVLKDSYKDFEIYDSKYVLPFATTVNSALADAEFGEDWVENHNILYGALTGSKDKLVTLPEYASQETKATETGYQSFYTINVKGKQAVYISIIDEPNKGRDSNASSLYQKIEIYVNGDPVLIPDIGEPENTEYMHDYCNNLVYLGCFEDEELKVTLNYDLSWYEEPERREEVLGYGTVTIAALDMNRMDSLINDYKSAYCDTSYTNDSLTVKVKGSSDNNMALIPVIYSDNWTVTVNGKEVEGKAIAGLFTGVELENGENTIVMQFEPQGKKAGLIATLGIFVLFAVFMFAGKRFGLKVPAVMQKVVFATYIFVYVAVILVMFVIPGVMAVPAYLLETIKMLIG